MSQGGLKTAALWRRALQKTTEQRYFASQQQSQLPPLVEAPASTATPQAATPSPTPQPALGTHPTPSHPAPRVMLRKTVSFQSVAHQLLQKSRQTGQTRQSRDRELKSKVEELENLRTEHEREKEEKKKLQGELVAARERHAAVEQRLAETQQMTERLRQESQQKQEQIEKYQRDILHMEDRIRNLEIRASEVDKAELNLESTRKNLESSQMECRLRENDIRKLTSQYEETCRNLDTAKRQIEELEGKIKDLKFQVRHELMKNERIEQGLDRIPNLEEQLEEQGERSRKLEKEATEKTALLVSARKAIREYKDKLRELENQQEQVEGLQEELRVARCEIGTLKRLMSGKDSLVQQKCQAISLARNVIDSFAGTPEERDRVRKLQSVLERLSTLSSCTEEDGDTTETATEYAATHSTGTTNLTRSTSTRRRTVSARLSENGREINVNVPPYSLDNGRASPAPSPDTEDCAFMERVVHVQDAKSSRPRTAVVSPSVRRTKSFNDSAMRRGPPTPRSLRSVSSSCDSSHYRSDRKGSSRFVPSLDYPLGLREERHGQTKLANGRQPPGQARPATRGTNSSQSRGENSDSDCESHDPQRGAAVRDVVEEHLLAVSKMTGRQKDRILSSVVHLGDRVSVTEQPKQPKHGRKRAKPIVYTGIIKYKGTLDKEYNDSSIYVGIRLDEPIGESDGTYKGKRYLYAPPHQAHFVKIRDVTSVLDVQCGSYVSCRDLLLGYLGHKEALQAYDTD